METLQTSSCGCGCESAPETSTETKTTDSICVESQQNETACQFLQDPEIKKKLDELISYPDGFQVVDGAYYDISPKEAYILIKKKEEDNALTILDVRTDGEFNNTRIPGSVQLDFFSAAFKEKLEKLDRRKTYIVFCKVGVRSKFAMDLMEKMGFQKVYNVDGGEDRWSAEGIPYGYPPNPSEWSKYPN
jgi:rhodanese-related sulfurtransferase